ncbi:MAG: AAA family ATPase [Deltaproteobacteria bacterium]|nr:AAA family ATPase [Deltaproteobacteria bacterium]
MFISRIVIRNFRNFELLNVPISPGATCLIGENNTGKSNLLFALRLAIDANLSSTYRLLSEEDIHSGISIAQGNQVVISIEFSDYFGKVSETALVGCWEVDDENHIARISYRFRPRQSVREAIENGELEDGSLTIEDYHWELTGGGASDPATVGWSEDLGPSVRFSDLQQFAVVFLHALRDVNQDLRQSRQSPLAKLIDASDIPEAEKNELVDILQHANTEISQRQTIHETGEAINEAFHRTAGEAFDIGVRLGVAPPSFMSISRSLTVLLSDCALTDFETYRNGLGLNNILYISMLLESFERRFKSGKTAGQILLIEEPEAHLHPQLQRVLYEILKNKPFQTILSSHSTHITSAANLDSIVLLTNNGQPRTTGTTPGVDDVLSQPEIADMERYLDATRSTMLYARKVILVEGPAELFVIPPLVKKIMGIDLERYGVSVIPIYGTHFHVYAKMFNELALPKKCVIIADGDLIPSDAQREEGDEDDLAEVPDLDQLKSEFVGIFRCKTTFERALTIPGLLICLSAATTECGASKVSKILKNADQLIKTGKLNSYEQKELISSLRDPILSTAKRIGKARFAQILSKHIGGAEAIPKYIKDAVNWLEL